MSRWVDNLLYKMRKRRFCKLNGWFCPDCIYHDFIFEGAIFRDASFREHLAAFLKLDGIGWNDYDDQRAISGQTVADSRMRTNRKMYERMGVIYKDNDKIRLSRLGLQMKNLEHNLNEAKERILSDVRTTAVDILSRYQLKNPVDGPDLPSSCDVLPCICIWKAMRELDNKIGYEEMNRVILHVMEMSQLDEAIQIIRNIDCVRFAHGLPS